MSTIVTRAGKGSPLTHVEVDANFTNLDTDKVEKTAAAITGGTINGTTIGATTPSTVNATTITGQTGVISGGNNNFLYSNTFTNAYWSKDGSLSITAGQTDPFGGTTATLLSFTNQFQGLRATTSNMTAGGIYTVSIWCYVASGTRVFSITDNGGNIYGTFTANTSWNRYSVTFTSLASTALYCIQDRNGSGFVNAYVYGAQVEQGSTASIYVPTTTAAINISNTLNIAGSQIFTATNGSLSLQPAGTGALQAQATTSTTAGGNARGANAVDWQTSRDTAARVASGSTSFIGSGRNNTSSGQDNFVGAGFQNTASGGSQAAIVGGAGNQATAPLTFIGSGNGNQTTRDYSGIVAGHNNLATGYYNLIGGGFANSGTANAAVTTQATTAVTSGSTAVTLSGSNANIKVGQMCFGTGVTFPTTYVAAISGTSLTLSQNATATGTPTLSFFTPHGVVVGGGNNQATGAYSAILGGGDAGTAANRNVASGDWSVVGGGRGNTSSGNWSATGGGSGNANTGSWSSIGGGSANGIYANYGTIGGGLVNGVTGFAASVLGGYGNSATGTYSSVVSGIFGTSRSITSSTVVASSSTITSSVGISQAAILVLAKQTTDATATVLTSNELAASGTNQVILPNNSAYFFTGEVISGVTGGGNTKGWTIEGVIKRGANAASTALVGTPTVTSSFADAGASTWTIAVTADTTNGGLAVTFTGQASTTIRTVAQIRTTEMTY
jgi:hypothetical protein